MNTTAAPPRPTTTSPAPLPPQRTRVGGTPAAVWSGAVLYLLAIGLLIGGAAGASGTVHAVGALLAACLLVPLARRSPLSALALTLVGATFLVFATPRTVYPTLDVSFQGELLSYLATDLALGFLIATCARRLTSVIAAAVAFTVQILTVAAQSGGTSLIVSTLIAALALAACCMVGLLSRERREHATTLRTQEVSEAVTAERLRIARELHDMVAHSIGIIAIQAGAAGQVIHTRPEAAEEALRAIETTSRDTLSGLRRTLVSLRRADPDALSSREVAPGLADLESLVAATAAAGVRVDLRRIGEARPLPADLDLSAYRIVQEALTNVVRHAGTGECRVTVDHGKEALTVEVLDEGRGDTGLGAPHGFGLVGMRERVTLLHGHLTAGPRPEGGFRVMAVLPLAVETELR